MYVTWCCYVELIYLCYQVGKDLTQEQEQADQAGDFVNMEVSLAYMAVPKREGQAIHADNARLMVEFFVGAIR